MLLIWGELPGVFLYFHRMDGADSLPPLLKSEGPAPDERFPGSGVTNRQLVWGKQHSCLVGGYRLALRDAWHGPCSSCCKVFLVSCGWLLSHVPDVNLELNVPSVWGVWELSRQWQVRSLFQKPGARNGARGWFGKYMRFWRVPQ